MTIIVDAAPIVAAADARDRAGIRVGTIFRSSREPLIVPAPVTAEVDYLLHSRGRHGAAGQFISDIVEGRFSVFCLEVVDYATILRLRQRYRDLAPGLADLSCVVLAERFESKRGASLRSTSATSGR